ncbi:hypothetical protein [Burkholderia latens]|uniref:hypothetical protein n=1 Tax=Burkholderia latens TaxID=488446 RepID=UPI00158EBC2A|nr:hypothetical protein [Burkholderia latens]
MTIQTDAIANADALLSRAGLYTHTGVLNELRTVLEAVKAGVPEIRRDRPARVRARLECRTGTRLRPAGGRPCVAAPSG